MRRGPLSTSRRARGAGIAAPTLPLGVLFVLGLFSSSAGGTHPGTNGNIVFTALANSEQRLLTVSPGGGTPQDLNAPGYRGAWSPDGRKIAFTRTSGQTSDIWVMNADGSGRRG